jgi:hypothetical protein
MADNDDTIRLSLEVDDTQVVQAKKSVDSAKNSTYDFAQTIVHASGETYEFADSVGKADVSVAELQRQIRATNSAVESMFAETIAKANMSVEKYLSTVIKVDQGAGKLAGTLGTATGGTRNLSLALLEGSRGLEDLQYGIGGVVNNVPLFVAALGGSAGAAGAISIVAVGINQLVKNWDSVERLFAETTALPKAADQSKALGKELETATKRMEEMEKAGHGTAEQIEEYNGLVAKTAELERQITKEKERQAELKKLDNLKDPVLESEAKERAAALADSFGGERKDSLIAAMAESFRLGAAAKAKEAAAYAESLEGRFDVSPDQLAAAREIRDQYAARARNTPQAFEANANYAKQVLAKAVGGDLDAFNLIQRQMRTTPGVFTDAQKAGIQAASPEAFENEDKFNSDMNILAANAEDRKAEQARRNRNAAKAKQRYDQMQRQLDQQDREAAEAEQNRAAQAKERRDIESPAIKRAYDAETRSIEAGGYVPMAEKLMAEVRAAGGAYDKNGRFRKMDADQQFEFVRQQVAEYMHRILGQDENGRNIRANPSMGKQETWDVSTRIAAMANQDISKRMLGMSGQGLNQQQQLIGIASQMAGVVSQHQAQMAAQQQQINGLQTFVNGMASRARANTPRGR